MTKLYALIENEDVGFSQPANYEVLKRGDCIVAGVPESDPAVLLAFVKELPGPFSLLYVLHTPRGEGKPGRYQSPELTHDDVEAFLLEFRELLMTDGRYDLWVRCFESESTLVWDRHDFLYAYGNVLNFRVILSQLKYTVGRLWIPSPHSHHYLPENDDQAKCVLQKFSWVRSELHERDKQ